MLASGISSNSHGVSATEPVQIHGELGTLDDESAAKLASVVEELLRELAVMTNALGQRESS